MRENQIAGRENSRIDTADKFRQLKACVLIPTYNNGTTLANLLRSVLAYTDQVIVVNDGSSDDTARILEDFASVEKQSFDVNRGKGMALRTGFALARAKGYRYAISIDSDGQHFPEDLYRFLDMATENPAAIIIGARNMNQATVPGNSSFGNRFSNFWFKIETGVVLPDTQSGYRLYPLVPLEKMQFFTRRFEFEIEVLVRASWRDIPILSVPVTVYYAPPGERISHFRPVRDFTRISLLNTIFVLATALYIIPRNFIRGMVSKEKRTRFLNQHLLNPHHSDERKSVSVAFGIFMGIIPMWGFQLAIAIFLAVLLKLNKGLVILAANISVPPMIPLIVFLSYKMGGWWMHGHGVELVFTRHLSLQTIRINLEQYLYGSITLAVAASLVIGAGTYLFLKLFKSKVPAAA